VDNLENISPSEEVLRLALQANLPVLLEGHPGTGKTTTIKRIADEFGWPCEALIAGIHEPTDINGIPIPSEDRQDVSFVVSKVFRRLAEHPGPSILFFDELDKAPVSMQNACLRLVLEKKMDDFALPSRVRVVAAINPPGQGGLDLVAPMSNRFTHIKWIPSTAESAEAIRRTAIQEASQFSPAVARRIPYYAGLVAGAIKARGWQLTPPNDETAQGQAWASPRTLVWAIDWFALTDVHGTSKEARNIAITGAVGPLGFELITYVDECDLPDPEEILQAPEKVLSITRQDRLFAVVMGVVSAIESSPTKERLTAGLSVCGKLAQAGHSGIAATGASHLKRLFQNTPDLLDLAATFEVPEDMAALRAMLEHVGKVARQEKASTPEDK